MDYTEIRVTVDVNDLETACAIAQMASPYGFYVEDYSDMLTVAPTINRVDFYDETLLAKDTAHALIHIYLSDDRAPAEAAGYIGERLACCGIKYSLDLSSVREEDWATGWKTYYKPFSVGSLAVCPSWESYQPKSGETVVTIDPGMAFGTGTHETTRLCLGMLQGRVTPDCAVLDLGCGTGILAIAAKKLNAGRVVAADVDAVAVQTARDNAALNCCELKVVLGNPLDDPAVAADIGEGFDLITANIVADVIIGYREYFARVLKRGGTLITSGIIDTRRAEVADALSAAGFKITDEKNEKCWVALVLERE